MSYLENTISTTEDELDQFHEIALICVDKTDDQFSPSLPDANTELVLIGLTERYDVELIHNFGAECEELPMVLDAILSNLKITLSYRDETIEFEFDNLYTLFDNLEQNTRTRECPCLKELIEILEETL